MKRVLIGFLSFLLTSNLTFAQGEMTLPLMENVYQSSYSNPSNIPDHKVSIGIPIISSFYAGAVSSGFAFNDGITKVNDTTVFDIRKVASGLSNSNLLFGGFSTDLFHFRIKSMSSFISFDVSSHADIYFTYPKQIGDLATLNTVDNNYNGKTFDLSALSTNISNYNQYAIGYTKMFKHWDFGVRLKLLQGLTNVNFDPGNLQLQVGTDRNDYTFQNSATLHVSGPIDTSLKSKSTAASDYFTNFKNVGFGGDFAATYHFQRKWRFSVALNNIGYINWASNTQNFVFSPDVSYKGLNEVGPLLRGQQNFNNSQVIDTLTKQLKPKSTPGQSYTTWLVPRVYFTAKYDVSRSFMLAGTIMLEKYKTIYPTFSLGAQYKFPRLISLTATSTYQYSKFIFGMGLVFKPGPFQFYVATDNLFVAYTDYQSNGQTKIILPGDSKVFNVRLGMNLVFGKILTPKMQSFNY